MEAPVRARANWPTVIGIISMVLGALAVLNAIWTLFWGVVGPWFFETSGLAKDPQFAASYQSTLDNAEIIAATSVASVALGSLLMLAGLRVNQRRASGVRLSIIWAWCRIGFAIVSTAIGAFISLSQLDATKAQMSAPGVPPFVASIIGPTMIVMLVLSFLWFLVYPVFTLIWFSRARVRETTATWPR